LTRSAELAASPGILGPSSPTKVEKNQTLKFENVP
jgi:hypothetical protein